MLWHAENHEPLTETRWDEGDARDRIAAIAADVDRAYDPENLWPANDEWDAWGSPVPLKDVYCGAAGVIWALDALRRRGFADVGIDLAQAARRALELWQEAPDMRDMPGLPAQPGPGLLGAEGGILTVAWRVDPDDELAQRLLARVRENKNSETNDLMWGSPGTMLIARAMHEWTGEQRWQDAWSESADELRSRRDDDGLWTQLLHGRSYRDLGPAHGAVANVIALGGDAGALPQTLERLAVWEDGLANWPNYADETTLDPRVQWCHGAPGIVISASSYLPEELHLAAAELTWRAGPSSMEKGSGICHGTAGSGYAFLTTFERGGDERWLERARRFAMHALEQVERRDKSRYSLFTGDIGVARYVADCLDARAAYPVLQTWD
jgi:lanthionine synthetase-like protein